MEWLKKWIDVDGYHIDLINARPSFSPLLEVSTRVINSIAEKYPGPYYLMVTGGVDSQTMLWCWQNSKVPFIPVSIKYLDHDNNTVNDHDLVQLTEYAAQFDLKINYEYFQIQHFLENSLLDYATKYTCTSPQITAHMAFSEIFTDGTVIFSGNFISHSLSYDYTILGLERYALRSNRNIIPFFLSYDPELACSIAQFGEIIPVPDLGHSMVQNVYPLKVETLKKAGIPIIPQKMKQTGFEIIKNIYDNYPVPFLDKIKYINKPSKRNFDILFRYKLSDFIKYKDKITYHNQDAIYLKK